MIHKTNKISFSHLVTIEVSTVTSIEKFIQIGYSANIHVSSKIKMAHEHFSAQNMFGNI